ncbi:membrane integrity-associated transporter subunit PqiC [Acerihabitans sp. TG2]|uniref:membrane integrity-associated transporter subunit PqiC n=1 Tax=Acerihabitans sp. TG2 TaxID=3096008 RepID=UPI002B229F00|nr:membrane integrity-associated transporter subunit PqiC [Acerihabitans sp. TG2]MEA9390676.1 membrane integrity-associated transporter subunit PqiC [Acerihabitans sp. TG2]
MNKGIVLVLVLLLGGCSGGGGQHYYQLPVAADTAGAQHISVTSSLRHIWVSRVNLSDFLAGNGVVYQASDVRYITAANNLWASPLAQQLQQTMVINLGNALPGTLVSATPAPGEQDTLELNISAFHGRYDGRVIIQGVALLTHQQQVISYPFALTLKQDQDGYDALVRTLAQGWLQVSQTIAGQILATR